MKEGQVRRFVGKEERKKRKKKEEKEEKMKVYLKLVYNEDIIRMHLEYVVLIE